MRRLIAALAALAAAGSLVGAAFADTYKSQAVADGGPKLSSAESLNWYVVGTMQFVLRHEIGHMLIHAYSAPVLAYQEDAADVFAAQWPGPLGNESDTFAAMLFFRNQTDHANTTLASTPWWDTHSPEIVREYRILCYLYADNPERYGPVAIAARIPPEDLAGCRGQYYETVLSWRDLVLNHLANKGETGIPVTVVLETPSKANRYSAAFMKEIGVADYIKFYFDSFKPTKDVPDAKIRLANCAKGDDKDNFPAFWDIKQRQLTLCYGMASFLAAGGVNQIGYKLTPQLEKPYYEYFCSRGQGTQEECDKLDGKTTAEKFDDGES
jgi:hypothetical protein